jgi:dephospho-CoA kinase
MPGISVVCRDSGLPVIASNASHHGKAKIFVVGLTGGIGSGKSTVAKLFAKHGAATIDADQISRELTTAKGHAMPMIRDTFGENFISPDGSLNRVVMRERAFADGTVKANLEAILHPLIREEIAQQMTHATTNGAPYVVLEIPLLFEAMSYRNTLSRTLCVDCPVSAQMERVRQRSKLTDAEVSAIIAAQIPRAIRLQLADDVIENVANQDDLIVPVASLHEHYLSLAARPESNKGQKF